MINFIKGLGEVEGAQIDSAATINKTSYYLMDKQSTLHYRLILVFTEPPV